MSKQDFENLLKKHEGALAEQTIDWEKQKQEWLEYIDKFYRQVEAWFKPFKEQGKLSYTYKDTQITEDYIGTYNVKMMAVDFAGQKLTLEPSGTLLIGTKGRIDMEGARGKARFILVDKDSKGLNITVSISTVGKSTSTPKEQKEPNWTWKILLREPHKISYAEFTEENFFDALMEIVNV